MRLNEHSPAGNSPGRIGRLFVAASFAARKGSFQEASRLLVVALESGHCSKVDALDLQARIYAQQGSYLDAEACWRKAIALDGSNPVYAKALGRLRSVHRPMIGIYRVVAVAVSLAVILLLCWQMVFVNRDVRTRQGTTAASIAALREDVNTLNSQSISRNQQLVDRLSAQDQQVNRLEDKLTSSLKTMPTLADMSEDRKAILASIKERMAVLENGLNERLETIRKDDSTGNALLVERVESMQKEDTSATALLAERISSLAVVLDGIEKKFAGPGSTKAGRQLGR
jgi:tetratricopeptide (TPR) repeat protein